jgi:hypothetical protein
MMRKVRQTEGQLKVARDEIAELRFDPFDFSGSSSVAGDADTSADVQVADECFEDVTVEVLVRPNYIGVVLHPDTIKANEIGSLSTIEKWTPTKADIDALEERLHPYLQLSARMTKEDVDRAVTTYFRQYYGYVTDERKMIGVTLLSPRLVEVDTEVNGEPSIPSAIYFLTSGIVWVWDAEFECQQYFFDATRKEFRVSP